VNRVTIADPACQAHFEGHVIPRTGSIWPYTFVWLDEDGARVLPGRISGDLFIAPEGTPDMWEAPAATYEYDFFNDGPPITGME
jgi:hypothetical protein